MKKVIIDCEQNDWEDIRCGGPQFLGFEFIVDSSENNEELEHFLRKNLKIAGHHCLGIKIYELDPPKVWTRGEMEKCIKNTIFAI